MSAKLPSRFDVLADRLVDAVAPRLVDRVAELVAQRFGELPPLLDSAAAAKFLGIDEVSVRRMALAGQIPAIRLGHGPKARWRFDADQLRLQLSRGSHGTPSNGMASDGKSEAAPAGSDGRVKPPSQPHPEEPV